MLHRKSAEAFDDYISRVVEQNISAWLSHDGIKEWWQVGMRPPHILDFEAIVKKEHAKLVAAADHKE